MKKRMQSISHFMLESERKIDSRIIELGSLCMEANELFREGIKGNSEKFCELAKKCVEISIASDAISYELYLGEQVTLEELNKKMNETVKKL